MSQDQLLENIISLFSAIAAYTKISNGTSRPNVNDKLEYLYTGIFNIIYDDKEFIHLDPVIQDHQAIDIIDVTGNMAIQVTAVTKSEKVKKTVQKLKELQSSIKYLIILYTIEAKPNRKNSFNHNDFEEIEIWDLTDLTNRIRELDHMKTLELSDHLERQFPMVKSYIANLESKRNITPDFFIQELEIHSKFLKRKVSPIQIQDAKKRQYLPESPLIEAIKSHEKVLLLGDPGMGKTLELKQTAYLLSKEGKYFPIYFPLNSYLRDEPLSEAFPKEWKLVNPDNLVLLLDGMDEVGVGNYIAAKKRIIDFSIKYPEIKLVFSCRSSFYESINLNQLVDFQVFQLNKLEYSDIQDYVETFYGSKGEHFLNECYLNDLMELASVPFYLNLLIADFIANSGKLLGSRSEILSRLFKNRIDADLNHFQSDFSLLFPREKVLKNLRKLASVMVISGKSSFVHGELELIIHDEQQLTLLGQLMILNKEGNQLYPSWKFEHNNLKEYFCAQALIQLDFEGIKKLVCMPSSETIKANWFDTLTLFLNIVDQNSPIFKESIELLLNNEYQTLVFVEKQRIPVNIRFEVLKKILEYFKEKNIWLHLIGFREERLADFAQSTQSLLYCLNEIENIENSKRSRLNCLFVLNGFKNLEQKEKEILKQKLFPVLVSNKNDEYFSYHLIEVLAETRITDPETASELMDLFKGIKNQYIRAGLYKYLPMTQNPDVWVEYYLEGIKIKKGDLKGRSEVEFSNEGIFLTEAFKSVQKTKFLEIVLDHFKSDNIYESYYSFPEILEDVINNCIDAYHPENTVFEKVLALMLKITSLWNLEYIKIFKSFFEKTHTKELALEKVLVSKQIKLSHNEMQEMIFFIDQETFPVLIPHIENNTIPFEALEGLFYGLRDLESDFCEQFREQVEMLTNKRIYLAPRLDPAKQQEKQFKKRVEVWFNNQGLKAEIIAILGRFEPLTPEILSKSIFEGDLKDGFKLDIQHTAKKILRNLAFDHGLSNENILKWVNDKGQYFTYLVSKIYEAIQGRQPKFSPSADQMLFIQKWFDSHVSSIEFNKINFFGDKVNLYELTKAKLLTYFFKNYPVDCKEEFILNMLAFCNETHGSYNTVQISDIVKEVGKKKTEERVIANIQHNQIENIFALRSHITYLFKNRFSHLYVTIFEILTTGPESGNRQVSTLDKYFKYEAEPIHILPYFHRFVEEDQVYILDQIKGSEDSMKLWKFVEEMADNPEYKHLERPINNLRIRMGNINGLKRTIEWIKINKLNPFSQNGQGLSHFENLEALEYLMEILKLSYDKTIKNNIRIDTLWGAARKGLIDLASKSDAHTDAVIITIENFIHKYKDQIDDLDHNNEIIEDIKRDKRQRSFIVQECNIKEALSIYEEAFNL